MIIGLRRPRISVTVRRRRRRRRRQFRKAARHRLLALPGLHQADLPVEYVIPQAQRVNMLRQLRSSTQWQ